jgi:hypothetical protein
MKLFFKIFILTAIVFSLVSFQPVFAKDAKELFNSGLKETGDKTGHTQLENFKDAESLPQTIGQIIKFLLSFLGVFFLGLTIYGGFLWMTARGNDTQTTKARDVLQNALIGLIIVLISYGITSFVLYSIEGLTAVPGASEIDENLNL